jgi:hypothetical protein
LFLVTVFSVNFYLTSTKVAEGAQEEAAAAPIPSSLFSVTQQDVPLPHLGAQLRPESRQVAILNPLGKVEIVGTEGRLLRIEGVAHVTGQDEAMLQNQALSLAPVVDFGETMTVAVRSDKLDGEEKDTRRVDLRVEVPHGVELSIRTDRGDIKVANYSGNASLAAKTGAITVDRLTGALDASTANGKVSARSITGHVALSSQQGGVTAADILGDTVIKSDSGDSSVQNISGRLDFTGNYGKASILSVEGDAAIHSANGLVTCDDLEGVLTATVVDGEFRVVGGFVQGAWTISSTNAKVSLSLPKDSDIKFLGETNKGVIKGPTKQSPGSGTKTGALITEQMGAGTHPVTVRSDNGSIFVDLR